MSSLALAAPSSVKKTDLDFFVPTIKPSSVRLFKTLKLYPFQLRLWVEKGGTSSSQAVRYSSIRVSSSMVLFSWNSPFPYIVILKYISPKGPQSPALGKITQLYLPINYEPAKPVERCRSKFKLSLIKFLKEQTFEFTRICSTLALFHGLPHQVAQSPLFSPVVVRHSLAVFRQDRVNKGKQ